MTTQSGYAALEAILHTDRTKAFGHYAQAIADYKAGVPKAWDRVVYWMLEIERMTATHSGTGAD